jgi:GTP-binding protein
MQVTTDAGNDWRTRALNFFLIDESYHFVDLPGYGYAKVPKGIRDAFGEMVEGYLRDREPLKLAIMLVDSRIPPTDSDLVMKEWLDHYGIPNLTVLTKSDKISRNEQAKALRTCAETLQTKEIIVFSAITGFGKEAILKKIRDAIDHTPTQ